MKLLVLFTVIACFQVSARGYSQRLSLTLRDASLEKAFKEIKRQTGYSFIYTRAQLKNTLPVNCEISNGTLQDAIDQCFQNQPVSAVIEGRYIVVQSKATLSLPATIQSDSIDISGVVTSESGEPLAGVTVVVKATGKSTTSNEVGRFSLKEVAKDGVLIVSSVGYQTREVKVSGRASLNIRLNILVNTLDETIVIAYGTTSRRFNTGSITKITASEIERQPVSNPLSTLQGRVPGMLISQTSGVPGSSFSVTIRGRTTLDPSLSRNDPLFVIDGVPFEPGNIPSNQLLSAANKPRNTSQGGLSPLNTINPMDIESIEVLKDADATAIYGSRGANGVILITTKKGKAGHTGISLNLYNGWSRVSRMMEMLDTKQYIQMRREAIANDGFVPQTVNGTFSNGYAPDILLWDTTKFVDHQKLVIGNTAMSTDASLSVTGGKENTQFRVGGGYHRESNVFSRDLTDRRASLNFNIAHSSSNKKFSIQLSGLYSSEKNNLVQHDLTQYINLPPNFDMYDSTGRPNWSQQGIPINYLYYSFGTVPAAELLKKYTSVNSNLMGNLQLRYRIGKELVLRTSLGYNKFGVDEESNTPKAALSPFSSGLASANFANSSSTSWIIEPNIDYTKSFSNGRLNVLFGSTISERESTSRNITATNYTSDLLLSSIDAAGQIRATNAHGQYRYAALFGRLNYILHSKYIVNLSGRRDGSTRFGPANRFANFGAAGVAWLFSSEKFILDKVPFISFGKLRTSYGVTGNDQIGDYQYLDLWASTGNPYQTMPGLMPARLYNPAYQWEKNKKFEVAVELGLARDIIFISTAFSVNRSSNQLINYKLPNQTGFASVNQNFPATVQNNTWELVLTSKNIVTQTFQWTTSANITIPDNKLVSFPGLESSSYAQMYREGQSISILRLYQYEGVDPVTGVYKVTDLNGDGIYNAEDFIFWGSTDPQYYGGLQNNFTYKGFDLGFLFEFRKQMGRNYLAAVGKGQSGLGVNQPAVVLDRWRKPGDITPVQKFSSSFSGPVAYGASYLNTSQGGYSDASFARLKNISLSWAIPPQYLSKIGFRSAKVYFQAHNLFVITEYLGSDPETQDVFVLPPLRTLAFGFQMQL